MKFYFRERKKPEIKEAPKSELTLLLENLEQTKCELDTAYRGFDYATDPDLIDCYIYDINAVLKRYRFLLAQIEEVKQQTITYEYPETTYSQNPAAIFEQFPEDDSLDQETSFPAIAG